MKVSLQRLRPRKIDYRSNNYFSNEIYWNEIIYGLKRKKKTRDLYKFAIVRDAYTCQI